MMQATRAPLSGVFAAALVAGVLVASPASAQEGDVQALKKDAAAKVDDMKSKQSASEQKKAEAPEPSAEQLAKLDSLLTSMGNMVADAGRALERLDAEGTTLEQAREQADFIDQQATAYGERYQGFNDYFDQEFNSPQEGVDNGGDEKKAPEEKKNDLFEDAGPDIPVSEYVPEAERMLTEMRADLSKALDQLARARQNKDAVKLNYVNEQVTTMKGILRISEDAFINLQEAMSSNALEKARYEFGKIRVSHRKMKELAAAVQNAKGAEASYTGGTDVQLEVDQAIVGGDPYYGNQEFFTAPQSGVVDSGDDGVGSEDPPDARPQPASPT